MLPSLTVITPTVGRPSLERTLDSLVGQLHAGDEWLVVGDGPQPTAREAVERVQSRTTATVRYLEHGPTGRWGNAQRQHAMSMAGGDYLWFVDDDDMAAAGAVQAIRQAIAEHPGHGFMFRMDTTSLADSTVGLVLWKVAGDLRWRGVGGPMFVAPNDPQRLGRWDTDVYAQDWPYIRDTVRCYPDGWLVWRPEIIYIVRPQAVRRQQPVHAAQRIANPYGTVAWRLPG